MEKFYKSQIKQDQWILSKLNDKKNGFYVDIGAFDGIQLSNTYAMSQIGWSGICVECNPKIIQKLKQNRESNKCKICNNPIWDKDGKLLSFHGAEMLSYAIECNTKTITSLANLSISLNTLLEEYKAPKNIDYISLDIEGAELKILESFDFNKWNVRCWTVEHNLDKSEDNFNKIVFLLLKYGYLVKWHDWDIFAIKDDIESEYIVNGERIK
jgi:FkbM family methyltransferase